MPHSDSRAGFDELLAEGECADVTGWDFSWFDGRASEERPPWGYAAMLGERMAGLAGVPGAAALDLQTGGGEVLATIPAGPQALAATEAWPPNIARARRNLARVGARVVPVADELADLPFANAAFDLLVSRHPVAVRWDEIARVLKPGGSYLSQDVGDGSVRELTEFMMGPQPVDDGPTRDPRWSVAGAESAGLTVTDLREFRGRMEFGDVAAVVHFLRKVIWIVPGFSVEAYRDRLRALHERIESAGPFVATSVRFLIEARKEPGAADARPGVLHRKTAHEYPVKPKSSFKRLCYRSPHAAAPSPQGAPVTRFAMNAARKGLAARAALAALLLVPAVLAAAPASAAPVMAAAMPQFANWPTFHGNENLTGVSGDPAISTLNAAQLGVRWMTHTFGPVLSSPITKYSAARNKTLAYVVNENGDLEAIDTASGAIVWSDAIGVPMHATPSIVGTHLWIGTAVSGRMIRIDANTGAVQCQVPLGTGVDFASPVIGRAGGVTTLFVGVQDQGAVPGPMVAINDATCKIEWKRNPYPVFSGSWSPDAYGVNAHGVPLVIFGSGDPDCAIYALNARTGKTLWRVRSLVGGLADFGTGAAISPPGRNGFADGMAYVSGKDRILYGIDLTTGKLIWHFDVGAATGASHDGGRSTAALAGRSVVFGTPVGLAAVDAVTGKQLWLSRDTGPADTEILSSPLVTGPAGHQVVVYGDLKGYIEVASLATGQVLYKYRTGGYVISSAADSAGNLLIGSSDGFLYDLGVGGSNGTPPATTLTSPAGGTIQNPGSKPVRAAGTATAGSSAVAAVDVAVQMNGPAGQWWNARAHRWQQGPAYNAASLGTAGSTRAWSFGVPAPPQGVVLTFTARAVGADGLVEPRQVSRTVTVRPVQAGPRLTLSAGQAGPGSRVRVSGRGFAAGEQVRLSLPGVLLGTVSAKADGSFPGKAVLVPVGFDYGLTAVTATGGRSGRSATAPLDVTGPWSQLGYDPQRTADQPFDHVLSQEVTPGKQYRMMPYWVYSASAPIGASPAVANGLAFTGDQSGTVSAVRIATGALAWSAAAGGSVQSSPAVDHAAGLVVVGSSDGGISAYLARTGKLAWRISTSGAVKSSPLIYNGTVYVASENSKLYAITEKTGKIRWTAPLAGPADGSPALDPRTATVVIGDASGAVTAFHAGATSVRRLWRVSVGGAVDNSPVIAQGRVFVGSANGVVSARSEATGNTDWSKSVGPSVTGQMAYQAGHLYVGAADGSLTALQTGSGAVMWSDPLAGPVTGVSVTDGMLFTESADGTVTGLRIGGEVVWLAKTGAALAGSPAIMDNAVFVGGEDNGLYAYTPFGEPVV